MLPELVIIGAGPHAREIGDIVDAINAVAPRYQLLGHVVDPEFGAPGDDAGGRPIIGGFDQLRAGRLAVCGIGNTDDRRRAARRAPAVEFPPLVHPHAVVPSHLTPGPGTVIAAGCVLTREIRIGAHVHLNIGCTVNHECDLGDFCYIAPGVHLAGRVAVGEGCWVGIGASVLEGRSLGAWSCIGAGAAVIDDVPANATAAGVPARVISTRPAGWQDPA